MNILNKIIIAKIQKIASRKPQIISGYLFGSYQTGKTHITSDIDLGFICFDKSALDIPSFMLNISSLFTPKDADVIVCDLNEKPIILMEMINGRLIYQKDSDLRIKLETRIFKLYEDYLHYLSIKKIYLDKSFSEGIYAHK